MTYVDHPLPPLPGLDSECPKGLLVEVTVGSSCNFWRGGGRYRQGIRNIEHIFRPGNWRQGMHVPPCRRWHAQGSARTMAEVGAGLGFILRSNSVYSVTFLSNPAELRYPMPPEHTKGTPKERVYTSATADLHTYILRMSVIKFTFLPKKTTTHQWARTKQDVNLWIIYPDAGPYGNASCTASYDYCTAIADKNEGRVVSIRSTRTW